MPPLVMISTIPHDAVPVITFTPPEWVTADHLYEDLLGRIFGYLEDDFASLKACSLVCKTWGISTRQYVFKSIQVRPNNYAAFADIMEQHFWPTLIPNVRCIDGHGDPGVIYKESPVFDALGYLLTHITIRNAVTVSFEFIINNIICNSPQLVALAILNVDFPLPTKVKYDGRFLPRTVRRVRLRQTPLAPFFAWFIAHPELPPLTHLDFGGVDEHNLFPAENVLALALPTLQHISLSFVPGAFGHTCSDGCDALADIAKMLSGLHPPGLHPNAAHFRQVFGIPHCPTFASMNALSVVQFENFAEDVIRPDLVSTAEFLAPRVCASVSGVRLQRVVFGLNISSTAQLSRYNINWSFFDEIFVSDSYSRVQAIEFRNSGRGNLDNIGNYISTMLPQASARNLLSFRKADSNLLAGHYE